MQYVFCAITRPLAHYEGTQQKMHLTFTVAYVCSVDIWNLYWIMIFNLTLQVCGVCVHQGYSTMASVVEAVHSTGVHLTQASDAEFALALYLKPYSAFVISVWVYVASLVKRMWT